MVKRKIYFSLTKVKVNIKHVTVKQLVAYNKVNSLFIQLCYIIKKGIYS